MKTIMHLDMNSYFATVEQQANPSLRGKPIGITKALGRGCVIAASIEAKKFGVKTGSTVWEAKALCPQITFVPADMDKYFAVTQGFVNIVKDYSPSIEIFSIDEMFADITDTQKLFAGGAYEIALEIKQRIKRELGEWIRCSIGISFSKLVAKLASELNKPDGLVFLSKENYLKETEDTPVGEVCGIGYARTRLLQSRGAYTLGQARKMEHKDLTIENLVWLKVDEPIVTTSDLEPAKSVSRTFTTFRVFNNETEILTLVRNLVEEACLKLREMDMVGRTFCLSLDGFWARRTILLPTCDPLIVWGILKNEYTKRQVVGIRKAGVWITNLIANSQLQIDNSREGLFKATDKINSRFGLFTVYPASLLGTKLIRPEVTGFLGDKWYRFGDKI